MIAPISLIGDAIALAEQDAVRSALPGLPLDARLRELDKRLVIGDDTGIAIFEPVAMFEGGHRAILLSLHDEKFAHAILDYMFGTVQTSRVVIATTDHEAAERLGCGRISGMYFAPPQSFQIEVTRSEWMTRHQPPPKRPRKTREERPNAA